jgi:hypothetical protein
VAKKSDKYVENLVPELPNPHPKFPSFSDAVRVVYGGPDVGRFCVAGRQIEPGELIAVETPYVWLLDKVPIFSNIFWWRIPLFSQINIQTIPRYIVNYPQQYFYVFPKNLIPLYWDSNIWGLFI